MNPEILARKAEDNISKMTFVREFSDDHIPCAAVNVTLVDGSVVENVEFFYIGSEGVAALRYSDTKEGMEYIRDNILQQAMDDALCVLHDDCSDEQTEKMLSLAGVKLSDVS